jgi:hypothetical protein
LSSCSLPYDRGDLLSRVHEDGIVGGLLAGSLVLGVVMGIVGGPGPGVFVAGSLVGIVLWVASSMVVAASDQAS